MKKRWLSLFILLSLCLGSIGGCKKTDPVVEGLNINGSDVVLKIGEKVYTADELFADMLKSEIGIKSAYQRILKAIVLNSVEDDSNLDASWELKLDSFNDDVSTYMKSNSVSKSDAEKAVLKEAGYETIDEMKEDYYYTAKLAKLQTNYWNDKKDYYYEQYLANRLPYYVRHALVMTGYTSNRGVYASVIDSNDAKNLYQMYSKLAAGDKFYTLMEISEDSGSNKTGQGYMMDLTKDDFATEFLHGAILFDTLLKDKTDSVLGLTSDILSMFKNTQNGGYNFNVINASDIVALNDVSEQASSSYSPDYIDIVDEEGEKKSNIYTAYGQSALYSRSIIFNQIFNNSGISVITYDIDENVPSNTTTVKINGVDKKVLTDENGNIVFVICARTTSELRIHFMVIDVSPFDEKAQLFFSMDQEKTIEKMVSAKETSLKEEGKTDAEISEIITAYKKELNEYKTYVDIKGGEKVSTRNTIVEELEEIVKSYAERGTTTGSVSPQEQFLTYDMVQYYMEKGKVTFKNQELQSKIQEYISNQKALIDSKTLNTIANGWENYYSRAKVAASKEIQMKKIPIECSFYTSGDKEKLKPCTYSYEKGFKITVTYDTNGGSFNEDSAYSKYFYIGQTEEFILPTAADITKEGATFGGWYYTSTFDEGTEVTSIITSRSTVKNKTKLYAKWIGE